MRAARGGGRSLDGLGVLLEVAREAAAHHAQAAVLEVGEALQGLDLRLGLGLGSGLGLGWG